MKNFIKVFAAVSLSACIFLFSALNAFAADGSSTPSKGVRILALIVIFILSTVIAAFVSYRIKSADVRKNNENKPDNKTEK